MFAIYEPKINKIVNYQYGDIYTGIFFKPESVNLPELFKGESFVWIAPSGTITTGLGGKLSIDWTQFNQEEVIIPLSFDIDGGSIQ